MKYFLFVLAFCLLSCGSPVVKEEAKDTPPQPAPEGQEKETVPQTQPHAAPEFKGYFALLVLKQAATAQEIRTKLFPELEKMKTYIGVNKGYSNTVFKITVVGPSVEIEKAMAYIQASEYVQTLDTPDNLEKYVSK